MRHVGRGIGGTASIPWAFQFGERAITKTFLHWSGQFLLPAQFVEREPPRSCSRRVEREEGFFRYHRAMKLAPFLLDQWLSQKLSMDPPIEFDLGSSTGPIWTLREVLSLGGDAEELLDTKLFYTPPAGSVELREELARMEGVEPEDILVMTGAAEALLILFHLAAEPGANVVLPHPGFPANEAVAASLGLEIRHYTLRAADGFQINPDEIRHLVDHDTRLVLVNSPHNPTGAVLSEAEMDALHAFCAERDVRFVCDEVYHPIYHGPMMRSASRLPHATVLGDFSKALCLSGLRIGWMVERDHRRREEVLNARSYFTVSGTALGERVAALAARHRESIYERARHVAQANLALLDPLFATHADILRWVRPAGGMTAFPWLASGVNAREFCRSLAQRGVLIVPGDCFGMPAHFRIGLAASGDRFRSAIERFTAFLETIAPGLAQHA
jgi:aspartate/methionine/tyrosine aminotransferase